MAEGVVGVLLNKLCELIEKEAHLLAGVKPNVKLLREKLEWISLSLEEADNKCSKDKEIKLWVAQVRDAAFEAEDIIDQYVYKVQKNRINRWIPFHKIGKKIQEINSRLDKISENRSKLGMGNVEDKGEPSVPIIRKEKRSPSVEEVDIVGIEDEAKIISNMLIGGGARTSAVSIVGMGGLGKTTLAKKLYNDIHVKRHFKCCAWTYVSQEFMLGDLLYDLIKCIKFKTLSSDDIVKLKSMKEEELSGELFHCLKGRRYFIVIDDIWSTDAWDGIKASFPIENKRSRIMITTRNRDVAKYADPQSKPYELRLLKDEESWELLSKKALLGVVNDGNLDELEEVGKDVAKRCRGLPLAVVVLGGLLSRKEQSVYEWKKVGKSIDWHLDEGQNQILPILALSYNDLPYYLKMCFLYFAAFPEDSSISATELFRMWVAEGFVQERGGETLEEVAEDYLLELIQRSLVQVAKRRFNGQVNKCRIHDLLRELAIKKAKENQFLNVNSVNATIARRLSITTHSDIFKDSFENHSAKHIRSLFCSFFQFDNCFWKSLYRRFKLLRVIQLDNVPFSTIPDEIGNLIYLRYLNMKFKGTRCLKLPATMDNLYNLQTLIISCNRGPIPLSFVHGIWKMRKLRHLHINPSCSPNVKHMKLNELTNLQSLSLIKVGKWIMGDFDKLASLRTLGLDGNLSLYQAPLSSFIGKQENLKSLSLSSSPQMPTQIISSRLHELEKLFLDGRLERLPTLQEVAPSLTKLVLKDSGLLEDSMAVLEKLPKLLFLELNKSYSGKKMCCATKGFPMLAVFKISSCSDLEDWAIEEGAFANLSNLNIHRCSKLKMIPEGLHHVTTLQKLVLVQQPPEFFDRIQKDGLDWFKIQHVPSVVTIA
ncbi:Disease resistance protein [Cinnamomum micranthum f. kanehirae]|uniref:Disease resistance protein n=1 Tax=Cinnamomum micranthum f. kanehirae TaxID=337451 RepID=A0A443P259_9MAGN|nr:Disease resistance protein [Cinnamomum micranthum f. kanehirae]